jgi:hypothetical protein
MYLQGQLGLEVPVEAVPKSSNNSENPQPSFAAAVALRNQHRLVVVLNETSSCST